MKPGRTQRSGAFRSVKPATAPSANESAPLAKRPSGRRMRPSRPVTWGKRTSPRLRHLDEVARRVGVDPLRARRRDREPLEHDRLRDRRELAREIATGVEDDRLAAELAPLVERRSDEDEASA